MKYELTGTRLKWMAIVMMAIDHVGAVIVGELAFWRGIVNDDWEHVYWLMRNIGRLAFPIFCFLLTEGFFYTRSRKNYLIRLFLFAFISEIPFDMSFGNSYIDMSYQNVFFVLFLGFAAIWMMEGLKDKPVLQILAVLACSVAAELIKCDYGVIGVVLIVIFYMFRENKRKRFAWGSLWLFFGTALHFAVDLGWETLMRVGTPDAVPYLLDSALTEAPAILAFALIGMYNGEKGRPFPKYFFYLFYPAHLLVLGLIRRVCF